MCWGSNDIGQLGAGSTGTFKSPQKVELGSGCIQSKNFSKNSVCLEFCNILCRRPWEIFMCTLKLCRLFFNNWKAESWIWHKEFKLLLWLPETITRVHCLTGAGSCVGEWTRTVNWAMEGIQTWSGLSLLGKVKRSTQNWRFVKLAASWFLLRSRSCCCSRCGHRQWVHLCVVGQLLCHLLGLQWLWATRNVES